MAENWHTVGYWARRGDRAYAQAAYKPFAEREITGRSVFLWQEYRASWAGNGALGTWDHFPAARALAGYLKYILFPGWFEWWLKRARWDPRPDSFLPPEVLLGRARRAGGAKARRDLPEMAASLRELDRALAARNKYQGVARINRAAVHFNAIPSARKECPVFLQAFAAPLAVGEHLLKLSGGENGLREFFSLSRTAWFNLCAVAAEDRAAAALFRQILSRSTSLPA